MFSAAVASHTPMRKTTRLFTSVVFCFLLACFPRAVNAQYQHPVPQPVKEGSIAVSKAGVYAEPGRTYVLTNDISDPMTPVFLGKDVTLDLNGHTIRFASAPYEHIPNSGFEEGEKGWDLSKAPGARVVNTADVHVFVGDKIISLKAGDEITSPYVSLPVANRSYFAMCGVTGFDYKDMEGDLRNQMRVSIYVEDEDGNEIRLATNYGDTTLRSVPVENKSPRLGGGFVYAHLHNLPAGKYRLRVKAETDCLLDEIDIRPALDAGIAILGHTSPTVHYDHLYESKHAAFFDYTKDVRQRLPLDSIPFITSGGTVTIRNGIIENGSQGTLSWGIQSTAKDVRVILDNVKIINSGINAIAVDVPHATISHSTFQVNNPFLVNRHGASFYAVDLRGDQASEVSYSEFVGGQGCLVFKGKKSSVHHNRFVNKQMLTNHYSIMAMGDSSWIYENDIEPETGSGIEVYVHKYIDIFNNKIRIKTSPPTCEYGHEEYSTAAIRIADYRAEPGSPRGCYGNRIYNNYIVVDAVPQRGVASYVPMAWAIYYSASGGDNDIFGNDITINKASHESKVITTAFYISGGAHGFGGNFFNNTIRTNVPAVWIGTLYGGAANSKISNNVIIKAKNAVPDFKPFRMGWGTGEERIARNIEFRSNEIRGAAFGVDATPQNHSYTVYSTLTVVVIDNNRKARARIPVNILNRNKDIVYSAVTDNHGIITVELPTIVVKGSETQFFTPYEVVVGRKRQEVTLFENTTVRIVQP